MKCCGVNNYKDWTNEELNTTFPQNGFDVPESCCTDVEDLNDCRDNPNNEKYSKNMKGCFQFIEDSLNGTQIVIYYISSIIIAIVFFDLILLFAFVMCLETKPEELFPFHN